MHDLRYNSSNRIQTRDLSTIGIQSIFGKSNFTLTLLLLKNIRFFFQSILHNNQLYPYLPFNNMDKQQQEVLSCAAEVTYPICLTCSINP